MTHSVPDICDDHINEIQVLEPLFTGFGAKTRFCGEVFTIRCFEDNSLVKQSLGSWAEGKVMVVDGGGSLRRALLGDMLAAMAEKNGWQGLVINGCVRDVEILKTINIGVYALNSYPVKTEKRNEGQLNIPVRFAGVDFIPGQYLYADENGIVVAQRRLDVDF